VGGAVAGHRAGDRSSSPFQVSCGACPACREERFAACHVHRAPAGAAWGFGAAGGGHGGAVADVLAVPAADHLLHAAPRGLDAWRSARFPTTSSTPTGGAPPLAAQPGAGVLVLGGAAPAIGLYARRARPGARGGGGPLRRCRRGRCAQAERLGPPRSSRTVRGRGASGAPRSSSRRRQPGGLPARSARRRTTAPARPSRSTSRPRRRSRCSRCTRRASRWSWAARTPGATSLRCSTSPPAAASTSRDRDDGRRIRGRRPRVARAGDQARAARVTSRAGGPLLRCPPNAYDLSADPQGRKPKERSSSRPA
jgi:hypothetical protein